MDKGNVRYLSLNRIDLPPLPSPDSISVIACKRAKFVSRLINPIIQDGNLFFVAAKCGPDISVKPRQTESRSWGRGERKRWIERTTFMSKTNNRGSRYLSLSLARSLARSVSLSLRGIRIHVFSSTRFRGRDKFSTDRERILILNVRNLLTQKIRRYVSKDRLEISFPDRIITSLIASRCIRRVTWPSVQEGRGGRRVTMQLEDLEESRKKKGSVKKQWLN